MKTPDKIFISEYNASVKTGYFSRDKDNIFNQEYIRKGALQEWLRKEAEKAFASFEREELGIEAREKGLALEQLIKYIESL